MKKLKMIQVGSGGWGRSWLKFIHESKDWELAALVSRGGENLKRSMKQWQIAEVCCYTNLDKALQTNADAVLITVPHHMHVAIAKKAVAAGKHVLCEKPLSDSFKEAQELVSYVAGTDRILGVSQNFRYRRGLWQMKDIAQKELVDSLKVELYQQQGPLSEWRSKQASTLLMEVMIHHVDMARFLMNANATSVFCKTWNPSWSVSEGPANATAIITFDNKASMCYSGSWAARGKCSSWEGAWRVQFKNATALWEGGEVDFDPSNDANFAPPQTNEFPGHDREGILFDFAAAIRGERKFMCDGADNLQSLAIIFAAIRSFQEQREVTISEMIS